MLTVKMETDDGVPEMNARDDASSLRGFTEMVGESHVSSGFSDRIRRAASVEAGVLITGEDGTGKEVVARTLHRLSARAQRPFVAANCTAVPEALFESELFGHVPGAFPGANAAKRGLFERARGGTLFLGAVGEVPLSLQAKLLRVLQDQEVCPVGGSESVKVDVRLVCTTHRDLEVEIEAGRFREDLYYRINVLPLHLPPLRERREDIPALVEAFTRRRVGRKRRFSEAAVRALQKRIWRGNTRELENTIERALAFCDARRIDVEHLPPDDALDESAAEEALMLGLAEAARVRTKLADVTDLYILEVLRQTGGRKGEASRRLGIDRKTLYRRGATVDVPQKR